MDWGDGTAHDTLTGTSTGTVKWTPTHNYAAPGDYVIKLTVTGSMGFYGSSSANEFSGLLRYTSGSDTRNLLYQSAIQRVEIGRGVTSIGDYVFQYCYGLTSINIPDSVTSIGNGAFWYCHQLTGVNIPDGVISIGHSALSGCSSLIRMNIPNGVTSIENHVFEFGRCFASINISNSVTSIGDYAFQYCTRLASISIPDSVTSIGNGAFYNCNGISEYHFARTTPPTLSSGNAFTGIAADCIIYVPVGSLGAYQTATNWSTYADYMREELS